jgi:GxxExxY protein
MLKNADLTSKIIQSFYKVYNELNYGFLEKVYEKSMVIELEKSGLNCRSQFPIDVFYSGENVGYYLADIIVNDLVIIEVKAAEAICQAHLAQLTNYLKASNVEVGLVLNFGPKAEFKRRIFSVELKKPNKPV